MLPVRAGFLGRNPVRSGTSAERGSLTLRPRLEANTALSWVLVATSRSLPKHTEDAGSSCLSCVGAGYDRSCGSSENERSCEWITFLLHMIH